MKSNQHELNKDNINRHADIAGDNVTNASTLDKELQVTKESE